MLLKKRLLTLSVLLIFHTLVFGGSNPTADFSITPGTVVTPGTTVCFEDQSASGGLGLDLINWIWTSDAPGPNTTITDPAIADDPICVTYTTAGTYQVCLEVENEDNNTDQICQTIIVAPPFNIGDENGTTQTGCGFLVIDDGGDNNYGNNEDNVITICSGNGDFMQIDFALLDLANGDIIEIYNGTSVSGTPIETIDFNSNGGSPSIYGTDECITIRFVTNGSGTAQGFLLQANCYSSDDVIISANDGSTITGCGGNFYDSGGNGGDYGNGENYTVTLCADDPNDVIQILFQQFHLAAGDQLNVYDGTGTGGSLIYTADNTDNGNNSFIFPGLTVTGQSQCVTYEFISNGSGTNSGWLGNINCVTPPPLCNPGNNPPAADNFEAATPICDFSQYCGTTSSFYGVDMGPWGQTSWFDGSLENNSWLSFTADGPTAVFDIVTEAGCAGIQIGIYSVDAAGNVTWHSGPGINGGFDYTNIDTGFSGSGVLNADGLTAGETYYIMIDGHGGAVCDYTLTAGIGVQIPDPQITGPASLCFGDAGTLTVTDQNGSTNTNWIWTWNGGTGGPQSGSTIDLSTFPPGTYTFDVIAEGFENCADPSDVSDQFTVTINPCGCTPPTINVNPLSACSPNSVDLNTAIGAGSDPATISFHASNADANADINPISSTVSVAGTYFIRAEDPGDPSCFTVEPVTVTINPIPNVNAGAGATICAGDPAVTITASGDPGTFTWDNGLGTGASQSVSPAATTTYTVTLLDANGCSNTDQVTITVNPCGCTPPTFTVTPPAALCSPATYDLTNAVSGTGANIVSYHASNADANADINPLGSTVVSTSGTYYVRVEDPGDPTCFSVQSIAVTINTPTDPTFDPVADICSGDALAALPTTSNNGITGTWSPALNNTATTTYTFTPTAGQCANTTTLTITVNTPVTPVFDGVSPICEGDAIAPLPTTSGNGITGTWSPALNNTATTTYTFTPTAGQCATTTTLTITVNPNVTPTFDPVAAICSGDALAALPTTSNNGITGTWSPALDNTATTTYTFTPTAGQCATTTTLTITVNPPTDPTFDPVAPICEGDALAALPTTSNNGVTGTWAPALDNTTTTTYTFTPTAGQCANTTTLTITVNPPTDPTFDPVAPICEGDALAALPTTSNNGITGTWSPALDNTTTTTYTFTPTAGQCANTTTLTITVNPPTDPTFDPVPAICEGDPLAALPTTSNNGVTGTWSPALDNTATTTYTFTPTAGQCATTTTLTITVNPATDPTFDPVAAICEGDVLAALPTTSTNGITGTWSPALDNTATTTYTFTPDAGQCANTTTLTITVNPATDPTFDPVADICEGDALAALPTTSNNGITGSWSPALDNTATTTYTFTPDAGQCANTTTLTITVNPAPTFTVTPSNPTSCLVNDGQITISGLDGNTVYLVNDGSGVQTIPSDAAGEIILLGYGPTTINSITIEDQITGCTTVDNTGWTLTAPSAPTVTVNPDQTICEGESVTLSSTISGGTVSWVDDFAITYNEGDVVSPTVTTVYTATAVDNGCNASASFTITVTPPTDPTFDPVADICSGDALAALPTTSTNGITGTWSPALDNTATTTYTFTPDAGECANTTTLTINVNNPVTNTVTADICDGDTYTFADGSTQTITANTSLTTVLTAANGCDSTVTEDITMISPVTNNITANVCDGDTYTFADGSTQTITANTSLTTVLTAANGCDSTVIEDITMISPVTNTVTANVCDGDTYTFADGSTQTITANTSLTTVLTAANGCDSTVTEDITMISPVSNTVTVNLCSGSNHTYADGTVSNNITVNESYTSTLVGANGCDSTVTEDVVIGPNITNTVTADVCDGDNYTFADGSTQTITANVSLSTTLVAANGCDSIVTEDITMISPVTNTVTVNICSGANHTYADGTVANNVTVNESYTSTLTAANGCDSLVTEDLVVGPNITNTITANICDGDTYTFADGSTQTITANVSVSTTLTAVNGCDSIVTEDITMVPVYNIPENVNACQNSTYTYPDGSTEVITGNTSHTSNLTSASGCDSVIVTNVTMNPVYAITDNITVCSGSNYTYPDGTVSNNITAPESHVSNLTTASGCDSIITTNITISTQFTSSTDFNICSGSNYTYADGTTATNVTVNESYTSNFVSASGCDSLVTENLIVLPVYNLTNDITVCEGETVTYPDGTTEVISASTSQTSNLTTGAGCDSIIVTNVTMNPIYNLAENVNACENSTYTYPDGFSEVITGNTAHTSNLTTAAGCDSIIVTNVTMDPVYNISENVDVCENATYTYPDGSNATITASTSYTSNLTTGAGCDSIIVTNVNMVPALSSTNDITVCENETVTYPDGSTAVITASTSQISTLISAGGCDSIVTTNVTMNPVFNTVDNITVCEGETITYPDGTTEVISASTSQTSTLTSVNGCDSVITTNVTMNPLPTFTLASTDPSTCGASDGTITIGGLTANTNYQVSYNGNASTSETTDINGDIVITGLPTGTYTDFIIEDANGCQTIDNTILNISPLAAPAIDNVSKVDLSCAGDQSGEIHIVASGGTGTITYTIDDGTGFTETNTTGDFVNLNPGTYNITITDDAGCQSTSQVVVNEPGAIVQNVASTDILCFGDANGTITWTSVVGGTPPYLYSIDNGGNYIGSSNFTGLSGGTYNVTVTDLNGCNSDTAEVVIFEPNELLLTVADVPVSDPTCVGGSPSCNGDITINVPVGGGVAPYSYIWPNNIAPLTSNTAVDLCGGQYNIAVQDANGCQSVLQVNLVDPVSPVIDDLTSVDAGCGNDCNGIIDVTSSTAISFEINGNQNATGLFEGMCQGTYDVIVTGDNNCSVSQTVVIDNASDPSAMFTFDPAYASLDYPDVNFTNLSEFADSYYWWISGNYPNDGYFWATSQEEFTHTFPIGTRELIRFVYLHKTARDVLILCVRTSKYRKTSTSSYQMHLHQMEMESTTHLSLS